MVIRASTELPPPAFEVITDPEESARLTAQKQRADRNAAWLQAHARDVYRHRGKYFCVAGQELFLGDTAEAATAAARAKHPHDDGFIIRYIPREKYLRV